MNGLKDKWNDFAQHPEMVKARKYTYWIIVNQNYLSRTGVRSNGQIICRKPKKTRVSKDTRQGFSGWFTYYHNFETSYNSI